MATFPDRIQGESVNWSKPKFDNIKPKASTSEPINMSYFDDKGGLGLNNFLVDQILKSGIPDLIIPEKERSYDRSEGLTGSFDISNGNPKLIMEKFNGKELIEGYSLNLKLFEKGNAYDRDGREFDKNTSSCSPWVSHENTIRYSFDKISDKLLYKNR